MKLTLTNDFHRTTITLNVKDNQLTDNQIRKAKRALCGIPECQLHGTFFYQCSASDFTIDTDGAVYFYGVDYD